MSTANNLFIWAAWNNFCCGCQRIYYTTRGVGKDENTASWPGNGVAAVLLFYGAVLVLAAILSPTLFFAVERLAAAFPGGPWHHLMDKGFAKFYNRSTLLSLAVLIWPFLKFCGIRTRTDLRFGKISPGKFSLTFLTGTAMVCPIFLWLALRHQFSPRTITTPLFLANSMKFFTAALVIGIAEETIFRGVVLELFSKNLTMPWAAALASLFFAHCHWMGARQIPTNGVTAFSGFHCAWAALSAGIGSIPSLNFINLTALGILLATLLWKTGSLWYPIAFHGGTVFAMMQWRSFGKITAGGTAIGILDTAWTLALQIIAIGWLIGSSAKTKS
jgi:membrane protease YdiL (CAAX protease family)